MALNPTDLFDFRSLLSEEERMIQDSVARFTDERVLPIIGDCFDQGRFPKELVPEIARYLIDAGGKREVAIYRED